MSTLLSRVHRGLFFAVAALLMLSSIAPTLTLAQEGGQAADLGTPDAGTDSSTAPETTQATEAPAAQGIPWAQPIDFGVVVNNYDFGGLPAEGLAVRVANSPDAEVLGRLWEGERVEVTSQKIWNGDTPYYSVNFGAGGGYVNANFIVLDSEAAPVVTEAPVTEVPVTEVPVTEVPVTEVPVTEVPVTEAPVTEIPVTEVPVTEVPVTEAPVTEAPVTEVPVTDVPVTEVPVTELPATDVPSETVAPTESTATEVPTNVVVPIGTVTTDAPDDTETAGTPAPDETAPAADVTETVVDDTAGTPAPAETIAGDTTEVATDVAASPEVSVETTETPAVTETTASSETPVDGASTPVASETETSTEVAVETVTPTGPDLSNAIGSATVTGTNGEGIRCRVGPDNSSATIVVLPEGTVVQVFDTSNTGWLQISCGGQLGYGDINYLYKGGASDDQINQGGRLSVSGTGGGGVNCRTGAGTNYGVITVVSEGASLTVRGQAANGWTPVTCGGQNGYIYSQYVGVSPVTGGESGTGTSSGTTTITGTGGDGVRCRTAASTSSSTIMVVAEGASVSVRGASSGGWTPVVCGGQNGYIYSQYVGTVSQGTVPATKTATAVATKTPTATTAPGGSTGTGYVKVTGSGGGVNCRTGAGTNYGVITVVAEGGTVQTRSGSTNGWQAVICGGQNGFILGELTSATSGGGTGTTPTPTATATTTPGGGGTTGNGTIANTGGDGVYCRISAPSGNPITILPEGATVALRGTASNGWQPVICGGQNGFVSSQYLTLGGGSGTTPTATATTTPGGGSGSGLANGDHAKVQSDVNLRYDPSTNNAPAMTVPIGIVLLVTGAQSNGFYPVSYDGLNGWVIGDVLVKTSDALSKRGGSGNPGTTPTPTTPPGGGGGGSATGNALVSFAMGYLGYPYVAATHGPASFDCSGFTYWVVYNVTGQNIWYGLWTQISAGTPVDRNSLQPGDLVFFQNTYQAGLSHVGIYIGGDQFIHAENEDTGVRISSLSSSYYASRYYGARRMG